MGERGTNMKCKFCFAELEDGVTVCPACGKELAEPATEEVTEAAPEVQPEPPVTEKKKNKAWKIVLAVTAVVLLAVILAGAILYFMGFGKQVLHSLKFWRDNDVYYKLSYTVDSAEAEEKVDQVVATLGDQVLTNGQLQAYYWMGVYDILEQYGYYISMLGIDITEPLDQQVFDEKTGMTFEQMFLETALENWCRDAILIEMSKEADFELTAEQQTYLDSLRPQLESVAEKNGYEDLEKFIDEQFFPGTSVESYLKYKEFTNHALFYDEVVYQQLLPTQEDLEAYYTAHEAELQKEGFGKEKGDYYAVRHILVEIKGGTEDAEGVVTYSDAEWEACRAEAQELLNKFLTGGATEAAFAELANTNSKDPGSNTTGGLYDKLTKDYGFIKGFEDWYTDESRKPGDTGLVKNTESAVQGYHIMYFCERTPIWEYETTSAVLTEKTSKMWAEAQEKWPVDVDYTKIALGYMSLIAS